MLKVFWIWSQQNFLSVQYKMSHTEKHLVSFGLHHLSQTKIYTKFPSRMSTVLKCLDSTLLMIWDVENTSDARIQ